MCVTVWFLREQIMHRFGCNYTRCVVLIYQMFCCSHLWRGRPPMSFSLQTKMHAWVWQMGWHRYLLPRVWALEITKWQQQQKQHVVVMLWKKKQYSFKMMWHGYNQLCAQLPWERSAFDKMSLDPSNTGKGHEHFHYANYNKWLWITV